MNLGNMTAKCVAPVPDQPFIPGETYKASGANENGHFVVYADRNDPNSGVEVFHSDFPNFFQTDAALAGQESLPL